MDGITCLLATVQKKSLPEMFFVRRDNARLSMYLATLHALAKESISGPFEDLSLRRRSREMNH